jgi:pimeloyl-ACP methyl ester carboxylesterase
MPVMYINGLLYKFVPSSASLATNKYLADENVHLFPELSHWILAEDPELTASEIISFLQRQHKQPRYTTGAGRLNIVKTTP